MFHFSENEQTLFDAKEYYLFGKCLSFVLPHCFAKAGTDVITFYLKINALVIIHQKNDWHGPDTVTKATATLGKYSSYPVIYQLNTKVGLAEKKLEPFRIRAYTSSPSGTKSCCYSCCLTNFGDYAF